MTGPIDAKPKDSAAYARCPLFRGMNDADRRRALEFFEAGTAKYKKNEFLVSPGERMKRFALVLEGAACVMMDDFNGRSMIMANAAAGDTFGESLCYLERADTPVYVRAETDCRVLWMKTDRLKREGTGEGDLRLDIYDRFIRMLAERALSMNDRIQILSKGTLREKLITFFSEYANRASAAEFDAPFDRDSMAVYLSANRSALSRELSKMRAEGLIDYSRNHFILRGFTEN